MDFPTKTGRRPATPSAVSGSLPRLLLAAALALLVHAPARRAAAVIGANDVVPAATLLVPYFEVDTSDKAFGTTVVSVHNVTLSPVIVHATLWTDLGRETIGFNMLLAPLDSQRLDLRDLFVDGALGFAGFGADCESLDEDLAPRQLVSLSNAHQGLASGIFNGFCGAIEHADGIARGYITFDVVNDCTDELPSNSDYFGNLGTGIASNDNALWGEYTLIDERRGASQGAPMVHIEASSSDPLVLPPARRTFYYRRAASDGIDNREPLSQFWAARYFHDATDLVCWRNLRGDTFACGGFPAAPQGFIFPSQSDAGVVAYDHEGNLTEAFDEDAGPCFATTNRVQVGSDLLPLGSKTGWLFVDADANFSRNAAQTAGAADPSIQGYVMPLHALHPSGLDVATGGVAVDTIPSDVFPVLQGEAP
jgi:hypothetical protein